MHIALAPFQLKAGISENALVSASDRFFSIMAGDGSHRVYEVLKSYE